MRNSMNSPTGGSWKSNSRQGNSRRRNSSIDYGFIFPGNSSKNHSKNSSLGSSQLDSQESMNSAIRKASQVGNQTLDALREVCEEQSYSSEFLSPQTPSKQRT